MTLPEQLSQRLTAALGSPAHTTDKLVAWRIGNTFAVALQLDTVTMANVWVPHREGESLPDFAEVYPAGRSRHSNLEAASPLLADRCQAAVLKLRSPDQLDEAISFLLRRASLLPPQPKAGDTLHMLAKAGVGSIPIVGAAAAELFDRFVQSPLERRRDAWREEIGSALRELQESRGADLEALQNNDGFVDTVMQATHIAMRNSHEENRQALRNAIINSATGDSPSDADRQMFLRMIDEFTPWHLRILDLFDDPPRWFASRNRRTPEYMSAGLDSVLLEAFAELRDRRPLYDQVWRELHSRGLVGTDSLHGIMTGRGLLQQRTTERGRAFLALIRLPA